MDIINQEELKILASLGTAIWVDPDLSERNVLDTVSAVSLFELTPEKTLEKACRALLDKAKRQGLYSHGLPNPGLFHKIFYRLSPEERFVLTATHLGHWSYGRLGRILDKSLVEVQELLWQARLAMNEGAPYPAGPASSSVQCPEYNPRVPWTQKFLDNEDMDGKQRFFLVQHMLVCSFCAGAMARCKALYFRVNQEVIQNTGVPEFGFTLREVLAQSPLRRGFSDISVRESLEAFLRKPDIRFMLFLFLGLSLFLIIRLAAFTTSV